MSRNAVALSCGRELMSELVRLSKSRSEEARMVERARKGFNCAAIVPGA